MMIGTRKKIGNYVILFNQKLGAGTFSQVFKGYEELPQQSKQLKESKNEVAIKIVNKSKIQEDQYAKDAFYSQIRIMKRLKSSNIIQFYNVHNSKNNYYIILELAQGGTLRSHLRLKGKFEQKAAMKYLIQILNGFGELVKNGVIHRDLKPQNILIKDNILKIADFGFAKLADSNCFLKTLVGTPAYMAPQILLEQKYTYKCDIWSLGVITYEMMVGKLPWTFLEYSMAAARQEITTRNIEFPQDIKISLNMKSFISGCLLKDEDARYDWEQVFMHPLFKDKFLPNFANKKQGSIKIGFIMSDLRINLHSNNINLTKILSDKQIEKYSKEEFYNLISFIDKSIREENINLLFSHIAANDGFVDLEDLKNFFKKYRCRMTGIDPSQIRVEEGSQAYEARILMSRLKKCIQSNSLDVNKLFMGKSQQKSKPLSFQNFGEFILKIDGSFNRNQIECLFTAFDLNGDGVISESELHKGMCKIAEIVPVQEDQ